MTKIERSIEVDVPTRVAYDQWTQFEDFPQFMDGVERVVQEDDRFLRWTATIGGQRREWIAEIIDQTPDVRVAWTSVEGAVNAGAVMFAPVGAERTRVTLTMEVEPSGAVESVGVALGFLDRQVTGDLERFKDFIESRAVPTGAWRGEIHGDSIGRGRQ
jgi:uncharacterized membrane protein